MTTKKKPEGAAAPQDGLNAGGPAFHPDLKEIAPPGSDARKERKARGILKDRDLPPL